MVYHKGLIYTNETKNGAIKMAFQKDKSYWEYRLKSNQEALRGSRALLKKLILELSDKNIAVHKSYIKDLVKSQKEIRKELEK